MSVTALNLLAEMPVTDITPQNIKTNEISFSLSLTKQYGDTYRLKLKVESTSNQQIYTGQPGIYLHVGKKNIGLVSLYSKKTKGSQSASYWCDLDESCLESSILTICSYPKKPKDNIELCVQSMEYNFKLKDFIKK